MKILKSIQHSAFILLLVTKLTYAQDFKIAPNTSLPEGSNFVNASIASDSSSGFLVTWTNQYRVGSTSYFVNYACRLSKTGEMLDSTAIYLCDSYWPYYCTNAVFAGGNWIVVSNQGGLYEFVGAQRLTSSGVVLDTVPVNVCSSIETATLEYPVIATNGQEILCVMGAAASGVYGSIFDSDLNILVNRFLILQRQGSTDPASKPQIAINGNNFFITFVDWEMIDNQYTPFIKLVIINLEGQILSIQNVYEKESNIFGYWGAPMITTLNDTTYSTYFQTPNLYLRRYFSDGQPIDSNPVKILESQDFDLTLKEIWASRAISYWTDMTRANDFFYLFWPRLTDNKILMYSFKPDLSIISQPTSIDSQCQIVVRLTTNQHTESFIRASSFGDNILTAWIDGREAEGNRMYGYEGTRIYGHFFKIINLTVSTNSISINALDNSTATFNITSNTNWTVSSNQDWLTLSKASGSGNDIITLTAQANILTSTRTAIVTVSGNSIEDETITVTQEGTPSGTKKTENKNMQIYPNPTNTILFINGLTQNTKVSIYDLQGNLVLSKHLTENLIDISNLTNGIYMIKFENKMGIATRKFVKQ
jgi:hypothetical protein